MRMLNLGILAHVDAGKTSLTERLLFEGGAIARMGAVDEGSTQTDAMDLERRRGITIRSAVATFTRGDHEIHLIDTPGHADFIAEVERALGVLDGAILVLSAVEGVQAQTRLLMRTLKAMRLPTLLFVNKTDRPGARHESLLTDIHRWLTPSAISMREPQGLAELLADHNDDVLKSFLYDTVDAQTLHDELAAQTRAALVHPVFFGSAVTGAGINELLNGITDFLPTAQGDDSAPLDGTIFAIEQDKQAVARIFAGSLTARDTVTYSRRTSSGTIVESAKVTAVHPAHVGAGGIARLTGLRGIKVGDRLGTSSTRPDPPHFRPPTLETVVTAQNPGDLYAALTDLADQDPLINVRRDPQLHTITVSLYGEVQQEVLASRLSDEYGVTADFSPPRIICVERPAGIGSAVEFMGQSPYPATVGLRVEPSPSGNRFLLEAERGSLPRAFLTAIEETVEAALRDGLHGWQVTHCAVVLTHTGYYSPVTVAADFRLQTREVLTAALHNAGTTIYEPVDQLTLEIPAPTLSSVLTALTTHHALPDPPTLTGETYTLTALIPTAHLRPFERHLPALTSGAALLTTTFHSHRPQTP